MQPYKKDNACCVTQIALIAYQKQAAINAKMDGSYTKVFATTIVQMALLPIKKGINTVNTVNILAWSV